MAQATLNSSSALSHIARGDQYDPNDHYIAVMGPTGTGKSSFIRKLVGEAKGPLIGHGLESCTNDIEVFTIEDSGDKIHLIDTLGFDDTYRTDTEVLRELAFWVGQAYEKTLRLSGILWMHPISRTRMTSSMLKNLRLFRKLCGSSAMDRVILVTTMWDKTEPGRGAMLEQELVSNDNFWGSMVKHGSRTVRHDGSQDSALCIIRSLTQGSGGETHMVLKIQQELVDEGKSLEDTAAGRELAGDLERTTLQAERELRLLQEEMQAAIAERDLLLQREIADVKADFDRKLREVEEQRERLKAENANLKREKLDELEQLEKIAELQKEAQRSRQEFLYRAKHQASMQLAQEERVRHLEERVRRRELEENTCNVM